MCKAFTRIAVAVLVSSAFILASAAWQTVRADDQYLVDRINRLEAETDALRAQVQGMNQDVVRLPAIESTLAGAPFYTASNASDSSGPTPPSPWAAPQSVSAGSGPSTTAQPTPTALSTPVPAVATIAQAPAPQGDPQPVAQPADPQTDYYTLDQLKAEMKKLVWKKGDFSITPYGYLWGATVYETERSNNGDYTFYIFSPSSVDQVGPTYHVDAKSTRIGLDVLGPRIAGLNNAQSGGKVEFDFQGGSGLQENKGSVLLRHAYWEVKDDEFRLLAGQTWDVISPLWPNTIMYTVYWGAGNIGYRRAQFRAERYVAFSDELLLTMQGSINGDIIADFAPAGITAVGDQSSWPVVEGRTALTFGPRGPNCHPITLGVSGHIGEQRFRFSAPPPAEQRSARTWSFNVDLKAPITDRFGMQGEYQIGDDLSTFYGGILQGYNFAQRRAIYDTGGWIELWYDWTPRWHSHVGYTLDDPLNSDISFGGRTYNHAIWGNVIYDVTKQFLLGLEVSQWRTLYQGLEPGEATRIEFMARYGF
jgi:hypothetical protein